MDLSMGAWLNGCMSNDLKRLSKCIYIMNSSFIPYNPVESQAEHTAIHLHTARAENGYIII